MTILVTLQLENLPNDTRLETVESVIRRQLNEWLDFDRHPEDLHMTLEKRQPCPVS